jgi:NAD(P)H-hydrate epimerase
VIPILSIADMRVADAAETKRRGTDALVAAASTAVALEAQAMLGSCYGSRIGVIVGPGLNGADGRGAAAWLKSRGARVDVIEVAEQPAHLEGYRLVIDAAFGLGTSRPYVAPGVSEHTLVLAVDLPSGVEADTGDVLGSPMRADVTLTLGAVKPGLLDGPGAAFVGELHFAGLGIVKEFDDALIEDRDLLRLIIQDVHDHKWSHALQVFAGSTLMPGAADLVVRGALSAGASMIRLSSRGDVASLVDLPPEVVHAGDESIERRCRCVVAGPGLGDGATKWLAGPLADADVPVVLDADGLDRTLIAQRPAEGPLWVLTPHDGEFQRLTGSPVGSSRFDAVRTLARDTGCVVLLKGPTTVIAEPGGRIRVVRSGTPALATAGSGDVLAGMIGATIARGHAPLDAAALAAHLHGRAGAALAPYAHASQIPDAVTKILHLITES